MIKGTRLIKKVAALFLVLLFSIESFAAIVSDNDGSAFITKAEFDSLKNDFKAQIDSYNTSIDSKIDGAIAAYLAGIKISASTEKTPLFVNIYGDKPTFHHADEFNKTTVNTTDSEIKGSYGLNITVFAPTSWPSQRNGYIMMVFKWVFPKATFNVLHKLKWDKDKEEWLFQQNANDADVRWSWVDHRDSYSKRSGTNTYVNWCWDRAYSYYDIKTKNSISLGTLNDTMYGWAEGNSTSNRSYSDIKTKTAPSWSSGTWTHRLQCDAGLWTEIDASEWDTKIKHLWVSNDNKAIERKIDLTSDEINYMQVESADPLKVNASSSVSNVEGAYSDPKYEKGSFTWKTVYAMSFHGWEGDSTYNVLNRKTRLKPSEVKYIIENGLKDPIKLSLWDAPLFDRVEKDTDVLQFDITLSNETGYDGATLYFSKKTWANDNSKPADADIVKMYKDNETAEVESITLEKGKKVTVKIKNLKKDDLLYFSLVPESGKKAKIAKFERCYYNYR